MDNKNFNWKEWLTNERHISIGVAVEADLAYSKEFLHIPVHDRDGNVIFKKYRRAPYIEEGAKYLYEKGASVSLYGVNLLKHGPVVCCEGELDALALRSQGYQTVSSTGGARSFQSSWSETLSGNDVTVLFDGDRTGVEGALRVACIMPVKIAWIPTQYGKDITDVIHNGGLEYLKKAIENAKLYDLTNMDDQIELRAVVQSVSDDIKVAMRTRGAPVECLKFALDWLGERLKVNRISRTPKLYDGSRDNLQRAKNVPIQSLHKFNHQNFGLCVFHTEDSPSMKLYQDTNRVFCYGCWRGGDAIDVYMAKNDKSMSEAIKEMI